MIVVSVAGQVSHWLYVASNRILLDIMQTLHDCSTYLALHVHTVNMACVIWKPLQLELVCDFCLFGMFSKSVCVHVVDTDMVVVCAKC